MSNVFDVYYVLKQFTRLEIKSIENKIGKENPPGWRKYEDVGTNK